jgi:type II secretory pathway component GspD/PulD (secretin)
MRVLRSIALASVLIGCVAWTNVASAQPGGLGGGTAPQSLPEDAGKLITFELILIDRGPEQLTGEKGKQPTAEQILKLEEQGKLGGVQRLKLVALENAEARLTLGETAPVVTGRTRTGGQGGGGFGGGGFPGSESITYMDLGTTVVLTSRVEKDGSVVAQFNVQRANFAPQKPVEKVDGQETPVAAPPRRLTSTISTAARIAPGQTAVLCGQQTLTGSTPSELWVLVTAKVN